MPIEGGMRDRLEPGTVLVAKYKGHEHRAEVFRDDQGKTRYRLEDGREFKSPSAAGSAVMGGVACNGWRWWSREADVKPTEPKDAPRKAGKARTSKSPSDLEGPAAKHPGTEEPAEE